MKPNSEKDLIADVFYHAELADMADTTEDRLTALDDCLTAVKQAVAHETYIRLRIDDVAIEVDRRNSDLQLSLTEKDYRASGEYCRKLAGLIKQLGMALGEMEDLTDE